MYTERLSTIHPEFVEFIPRDLVEGVLYISERYQTASHKCACGCGEKVVTPLSPADWQLNIDQAGLVTLHPSVGNWNNPCCSHYWIRKNRIQWAGSMSAREIERVKRRDLTDKARYIDQVNRKKEGLDVENRNSAADFRPNQTMSPWGQIVAGFRRLMGLR